MRGPAPTRPMSFLLKKALNIFADSDPKLCCLALCLFPLCRSNTYRNDLLSTAVIFDDLAEYRLIFISFQMLLRIMEEFILTRCHGDRKASADYLNLQRQSFIPPNEKE